MTAQHDSRPDLTPDLDEAELLRWYWEKSELMSFARELRIRATGSKALLTDRRTAIKPCVHRTKTHVAR